jgi:dihydrofolate reductase
MKKIRYSVAMSLDGYIAGPHGEGDWILMDPDIDFEAMTNQFDTMFIGRNSFLAMLKMGGGQGTPGMRTYVFSRTLRQQDYPDVTLVAEDWKETVAAIKRQAGKDIWLMGGGLLFRSLLRVGMVDAVEVAVVPVLLGGGIPLFPPPAEQAKLKLIHSRVYQKTGITSLEYAIRRAKTD